MPVSSSRSRAGAATRREFLRRTGLLGAAALGGSALVSSCADQGGTVARPSGAASSAGPSEGLTRPLALHHDAALGPAFEPYVADFNQRYPYELTTSYVPQDYFGITQTQLAGGSIDYDVLFSGAGYVQTWYDAGWARALDDLEGANEILDALLPGLEASLRAPDGALVALPYYVGVELFCYNEAHVERAGGIPPETWDAFVDMCRRLKADGVTDTPYSPFWTAEFDMIQVEFAAEAFSDGAGPLFGEQFEPLFASDPVYARTLERWQLLYAEGLVPEDIFTTAYGDASNIFAGGQSTFTLRYGPQLKGWRDPEQSQVSDVARNALIPGETHTSRSFMERWMMTSSTPSPEASWDLLRYLAYKDLDGEFHVPSNLVSIDLGLQTPYATVNDDPAVRESWNEWSDAELLAAQVSNSRGTGPAEDQPWYQEFVADFVPILQDVARGVKSVDQGLEEGADLVEANL